MISVVYRYQMLFTNIKKKENVQNKKKITLSINDAHDFDMGISHISITDATNDDCNKYINFLAIKY